VLVRDPLAELEPVPRVLSDVPELPLVCANIIGSATTVTSVDVSIRLIDPPCGNPVHETQSHHGNILFNCVV
jgi:hypothetical protein